MLRCISLLRRPGFDFSPSDAAGFGCAAALQSLPYSTVEEPAARTAHCDSCAAVLLSLLISSAAKLPGQFVAW